MCDFSRILDKFCENKIALYMVVVKDLIKSYFLKG